MLCVWVWGNYSIEENHGKYQDALLLRRMERIGEHRRDGVFIYDFVGCAGGVCVSC